MTLDWILGIVATACGGLNVFQFIWWRAEKQKHQAEADNASADAKQKNLDLQQDQYDFLLEKLTNYQNEYFSLADRLQQEMRAHTETINNKCNEIAELKSQIVYFKGLRCYKSDCSLRIRTNTKQKDGIEVDPKN